MILLLNLAINIKKNLFVPYNPSVTAFAVPAPFTQGSLASVHEHSIVLLSESFS